MDNKLPIVVNLFAGPGAGKSTGAAYIFAQLKIANINAELVTEFAKDLVWQQDMTALKNQLYVLGNQSLRLSRCIDKVDVVITDSPLLMNCTYCSQDEPYYESLQNVVYSDWSKYNNYNFFIKRVKPYKKVGRLQDEEGAKIKDAEIAMCLDKFNEKFEFVFGDKDGYDYIVKKILCAVNNIKNEEERK